MVAFMISLSPLMALNEGPSAVEGAMLRRIWDLILRIVRLRASVSFQFVFSHRGVPRNETEDKAAEHGNTKPQSCPAWVTGIVTGAERQVRNEICRAFEEARTPRTHRSALLDRVRPAPKRTMLDRLGESLLAQFGSGASKHFGLPHRVLARKADRLECRWCSAQVAASDAEEEHPLAESAADNACAPDLGIATGKCEPNICPLCNAVCARRLAGAARLVKIHSVEMDCALALAKKARRAVLTRKNGYTCRVCGDGFGRRGLPEARVAKRPPDAVPTVEERPKKSREDNATDDGSALRCPRCAKRCASYG
ncbi:hypothetical protein ERJ75_001635300 [Trypanosoma vivax]|nr:hypothetical protein ERJ75_001636300 [Trypanosoma vivax]KAH8605254.1 hypothetical protein ERJ75_001635300 [Trypanosoma vivax]